MLTEKYQLQAMCNWKNCNLSNYIYLSCNLEIDQDYLEVAKSQKKKITTKPLQ
jgi:hypothetical protein